MEDIYRVLEELPSNVSFTATTKTLGIKVTKATMTGRYTISDMQIKFLEKLTWAYAFEKTIERNMPRICKYYRGLKDAPEIEGTGGCKMRNSIMRWEKGFNLFFKVFVQYKSAKKQKVKDEKKAFLTALLSLDDVELWEKQHTEHVYNVKDLIMWYNEHIDPFAAILIDPDIAGEIE